MDETAEELRAPLPFADSSHASSSRPSDETQEQLVRVLNKKDDEKLFTFHLARPMCKLPSERRDAPNGTSG